MYSLDKVPNSVAILVWAFFKLAVRHSVFTVFSVSKIYIRDILAAVLNPERTKEERSPLIKCERFVVTNTRQSLEHN